MQNNIEKFFQYDGNYAKQWLVQTVYFAISLNRNDKLITKIFELCNIKTNVNTFLLEIEDYLKEISETKYEKKRSPDELQNYISTWVYYSIFWTCDFKKVDNKHNYRKYRMITRIALTYHLHYLKYTSILDENSRINIKSIEYAAITVGRVIEILLEMAEKKSAYLTEKYFPEDVDDLFTHFINIIEKDYVEKECYFIKKNTDGQNEIFIKYDNPDININFQLLPSRRLSTGSNGASESSQEDENTKIIGYLLQGYLEYQKIVNLETGKGKNNNKTKVKGRLLDQVTQKEELLKDDNVQNNNEKSIEEDLHKNSRVRASLKEDTKVIPDQYKQRMINRLLSSSIAKQNMMLNSAYEIPPIENLSIFLNYLTLDRFNDKFSNGNLYISAFILSIILGREYQDILELLIKGKSNGCKIIIEKKLFSVKLDDKLFGSSIEGFSVKNGKNISFKLPIEIVELYEYIQNQISSLSEDSQENLYKNEKQYIEFIDEKRNSCPTYVNFDLKNVWKVLVTYSKNIFENNIASLFCIGKYTTLDRSALSYTSTHKSGQIHSNFLNDIYIGMDMQKCINHLLCMDEVVVNEEYLFDKKMEYVGSDRLIKTEDIKKFFSYMRRAMLIEDDPIKYFNLYAIYARYALSLLLATRYGRASCNLKYISFELNLIRVIEKSDDRQSGVRFIPLCRQAKIIIKKYKSLCRELGFLDNDIFFLDKKKKRLLYGENKNYLVSIFNQGYELDQDILGFIWKVPLNFGRHIVVKVAVENNFNMHYLQTMMGHYTKGAEQFGIVSTTDSQDYIIKTSSFFNNIGKLYGI